MADAPTKAPLPADRYDDRGPFAHGGTAAIHLVVDRTLDRPIATKVSTLLEPEDLERFQREARTTARLDHPNIVPIYDLGDTWFTMKRVHGETLSALIRRQTFGPELQSQVIDVLLKVCDALAFAHERGVIHRDLKPENIMVGDFGQVYLMDWGIASVDGYTDAPWSGTSSWMAPEQARGEECDGRTDVWGLGGLLYFALCGGRPNVGPTPEDRHSAAANNTPVRSPAEVAPRRPIPPELARIALTALQCDRDRRYPDVLSFAADLRAAREGGWWFERRRYEPEEEIVREGEAADSAFLIVEGTCEIRQNGGPIGEIVAGQTFGEAALVEGGIRTATVVALTPVVVRVLTKEALDAELAQRGWLGTLVHGLAQRFMELSEDARQRKK